MTRYLSVASDDGRPSLLTCADARLADICAFERFLRSR